jgi:argininosuccinate lyase
LSAVVKSRSRVKVRAPGLNSKSPNLIRGGFVKARLPEVEQFTASLPFDRRLYRHDIRGSIAHAEMLASVGLLSRPEARRIVAGLKKIEGEITSGRFRFDLADEDIHLAVERRLIALVGTVGAKLHTARSRNDQIALDLRMYMRDEMQELVSLLSGLRAVLVRLAKRHLDTLMPGYTHLQRAQPVSLAHHLLAYVEMFERDRERLLQALARADVMPLGAGALAATTLKIDRRMVARALGFSRVSENSLDAVSDRDFVVDFLSAAALLAVHLSRMCEELVLWSSEEFGFAELPEEFSTGSSMMPHKKNPDLVELIRAKSGRVIGDLVAMLTVLKGLPLAYNSDLQEDKESVFDALDTLKPALALLAKFWPALKFNREKMRQAAGDFALATDLAEYLVARGIAFRQAHAIVARLVRETSSNGKKLSDLRLDELRDYSPAFDAGAIRMLSAENSLKARSVVGGPAPSTVRRRLERLEADA